MKIIAVGKDSPTAKSEDFTPELLGKEARRAWELHQRGVIRELYFRADEESAVLILECADLAEAREVLGSLPLVEKNLISFELIPLLAYSGFERLFAEK
jgi:muconolactone delta-isomerase